MLFLDVYQEHGESIYKIFFPLSFLGCCVTESTLHCTRIFLQEIWPWITPVPEIPSGPYLASLCWCPGLLPVCSKISFVDYFSCPQNYIVFLLFKKSMLNLYKHFSSGYSQVQKVQKEICVMDELKNLLPICRWAVCSHIRLIWKNIFIRW